MVKHIEIVEKDYEILKRKLDLVSIENTSLKSQLQILKSEARDGSVDSSYSQGTKYASGSRQHRRNYSYRRDYTHYSIDSYSEAKYM